MRQLSIRSVDTPLAAALEEERRRTGDSLNATVLRLLRSALGIERPPLENGLRELAGSWSDAEADAFERATAMFEAVDDELWR